jgi:hypothetical protein
VEHHTKASHGTDELWKRCTRTSPAPPRSPQHSTRRRAPQRLAPSRRSVPGRARRPARAGRARTVRRDSDSAPLRALFSRALCHHALISVRVPVPAPPLLGLDLRHPVRAQLRAQPAWRSVVACLEVVDARVAVSLLDRRPGARGARASAGGRDAAPVVGNLRTKTRRVERAEGASARGAAATAAQPAARGALFGRGAAGAGRHAGCRAGTHRGVAPALVRIERHCVDVCALAQTRPDLARVGSFPALEPLAIAAELFIVHLRTQRAPHFRRQRKCRAGLPSRALSASTLVTRSR